MTCEEVQKIRDDFYEQRNYAGLDEMPHPADSIVELCDQLLTVMTENERLKKELDEIESNGEDLRFA